MNAYIRAYTYNQTQISCTVQGCIQTNKCNQTQPKCSAYVGLYLSRFASKILNSQLKEKIEIIKTALTVMVEEMEGVYRIKVTIMLDATRLSLGHKRFPFTQSSSYPPVSF